jgi:hypothetical protein
MAMNIFISPSMRSGEQRRMTVSLTGTDDDFIRFIDEGSNLHGYLGVLAAKVAAHTGLVDQPGDDRAEAVKLLSRALELLDRPGS